MAQLFRYHKVGANLLLKVSLFLHIFNQFFSGVTEWSEGEGVIHKGVGVAPRTFTDGPWAPHPQVLLASLEVLYSSSHVGALCYCFSWFIKCVWIIMEMLWFLFPIKILTWLVLGLFFSWIYYVSCCFLGIKDWGSFTQKFSRCTHVLLLLLIKNSCYQSKGEDLLLSEDLRLLFTEKETEAII